MTNTIQNLLENLITPIVNDSEEVSAFDKNIERLIQKTEEEFMNVDDAALFLKRSKKTIYALVSHRKIPHIKQGRLLMFLKNDLKQWLLAHRIPCANELAEAPPMKLLFKAT